ITRITPIECDNAHCGSTLKRPSHGDRVCAYQKQTARTRRTGSRMLVQKGAQGREKLLGQRGVVVRPWHNEKGLWLMGGFKETLAVREWDQVVHRSVGDEYGPVAALDLGQVVEAIAHQPADGQPGEHAGPGVRRRGEC